MIGGKRILLVIGGGIAAYKSLELIRRLRERGAEVRAVMTPAAAHFVTALSVASLSENKVYDDLFSLTDESEMGHIRLSREADLVVVAPATADLLARMSLGLANDLATTVLLASDKPILIAPSMNVLMWQHPATQENVARLVARGISMVGPEPGDLACGEVGSGRLAEIPAILAAIERSLSAAVPEAAALAGRLSGRRALVTSGPTFEPIDPVRFIGNRSSGKQGHAIAAALARAGADTILVSGPTAEPDPDNVETIHIETASDMLAACLGHLPVDIAVCAAAVADWRVAASATTKLKKQGGRPPSLELIENPDILRTLGTAGPHRPRLLIGFAAETASEPAALEHLARVKRDAKGCDWLLANDVSAARGVFGGDENEIHLVSATGFEHWPRLAKQAVAERLVGRIADQFEAASRIDA